MKSGHHGPTLVLPVGDRDHAQGSASAPVTLVEYGTTNARPAGKPTPS